MKDFADMTDKEFRAAQKAADLDLWSRYAIFTRALTGYTVFHNRMAVPKFILFERFKTRPRQLELIIEGKHPDYYKKANQNFDIARWTLLELESRQETDLTCSNTSSGSSTNTAPRQSE